MYTISSREYIIVCTHARSHLRARIARMFSGSARSF